MKKRHHRPHRPEKYPLFWSRADPDPPNGKKQRTRVAIYARVSTQDQHLEQQIAGLRAEAKFRGWTVSAIYKEKRSTRAFRPALTEMLSRAMMRRHDAILVWRLDRLGRSLVELVGNVERLVEQGVVVVSVKDGALDTTTAASRLQLTVLAAAAEYERELLRERTREGLQRARAAGKKLGRPRRDDSALDGAIASFEYLKPRPSIRECARIEGVPESTLRYALARRAQNGVSKKVARSLRGEACILRLPKTFVFRAGGGR